VFGTTEYLLDQQYRRRHLGGSVPTFASERRWLVLFVLCIAVFLVVVDNTIVNVALPTISRDLHASNSSLQWIVDGYSLPFAGLLLAGGGLSDRWGRRRVMQWALFAFAVFSVVAAFSHNVSTLLTARALMGASAAFIFPATLSTLTVIFEDRRERAKAFGLWAATTGVAIALGPVAGGSLLTHYFFGSIFLVNLPVALVGIVAIASVVPESTNPDRYPIDLVGLALGTTGVTALILAIIQGPSWGWRSSPTLVLFGTAVLLLAGFTNYELRREGPLMNVRIFNNRTYAASAGAMATNFFCLFGFIFLVTQYFQLVRGFSPLSAGVHTLPFAFAVMVATPIGAHGALRLGTRFVVSIGLLVTAASLIWMSMLHADAAYAGPILGSMVILAIGFSLVNAPSVAATMDTLELNQIGAGAAGNETTRELGGTMGVAIIGSVFASLFGPAVRRAFEPLQGHGISAHQLDVAQRSMQAAKSIAAQLPANARATVDPKLTAAFMDGFHRGCLVAAVSAVVVAFIVFHFLPTTPAASKPEMVFEH
jgi:DHA2 family multidrug resistance protein-like MFS transporter